MSARQRMDPAAGGAAPVGASGVASAPTGSPGASATAAQPPPFRIPGQHFAAASVFLVLGGLAIAWAARPLADGSYLDPRVVAAAHLFTLGWITTSIMGALYQFLPAALGVPIRWLAITHVTFWIWTAAVIAFVAGLVTAAPSLTVVGAGGLGAAILLFGANLAATLPRATRRGLTWWCVTGSVLFLLGAWVLGTLLAVNLRTGMLGASRFPVLLVHLHLAAGGWVLLTMIGVADRLLPMFLLSHGSSRVPGRVAAVLVAAGASMLLLSEHLLPVGVLHGALLSMAAGAAAFLFGAFLHYRHRRRPRLDPGMRLVAAALALLGLAVVAGVAALVGGTGGSSLPTAYGVLLVPGGLGLFVAGHYYKIVPFLTWYHRFGPIAAEREVPRVADLFDPRVAHAAVGLLTVGVLIVAIGVLAGSAAVCVAGAIAFTAGAATEAAQLMGMSNVQYRMSNFEGAAIDER